MTTRNFGQRRETRKKLKTNTLALVKAAAAKADNTKDAFSTAAAEAPPHRPRIKEGRREERLLIM